MVKKRAEVFRCGVCGNIVEVLFAGGGELVCCGKPMLLMEEKTEEQGKEKHVPVIEETKNGVKIKVGAVPHPMEEKHYIQWIEVITDEKIYRKFLSPPTVPEAEFSINPKEVKLVREYCNVHGHWKNK